MKMVKVLLLQSLIGLLITLLFHSFGFSGPITWPILFLLGYAAFLVLDKVIK